MDHNFTARRRASWRQHFVAIARAVELTARAAVAPEPTPPYDGRVRVRRPGIGHSGWLAALDRQQRPAA
jgi:hypothetical protein